MIKSPTIRLLLGLLITLSVVMSFCLYSLHQIGRLRRLQTQTIDLNRHDSLLLLRIQNDLNTLGLNLQDMTERPQRARIAEYREEFDHLRADLEEALRADMALAPVKRRAGKQEDLMASLQHFWATAARVFNAAQTGHEAAARGLASRELTDEQIILTRRLSALLKGNNEADERADLKVAGIYDGAERDTYAFLTATMLAIIVTSLYLIYSNRRLFDRLESFSRQRRVLAAKLISVQEEVLRSVSRELHDEFGQILTAVSAMLARAEKKGLPSDSPFRTELTEVREITHNTLEKMRSLSQMLHPSILDDYGLLKGIEWYTGVFERQTGIRVAVVVEGKAVTLTGPAATHCFRIVQEALNNAAKHSGSKSAEVVVSFTGESLLVRVHDFGTGMTPSKKRTQPGLGLIAMRERAAILGGTLDISSPPGDGTTVTLTMPLGEDELAAEAVESDELREVLLREL